MAKDLTPKYVVEIRDGRSLQTPTAWNSRRHGRPTADNLRKYVMTYAKSLENGGVNDHISLALGVIPYPASAILRENTACNPRILATWKAATFQVWE